jgi:hypothetical protein
LTASIVAPLGLLSWLLAARAGWALGWMGTILLALLAQAPFTVLAARLVFEPEVRVRDVLGAAVRALPRLLLIRVVQLVALLGGLLMFVLPGLWAGVALLFVVEVAILERAGLGVAISRSLRITTGQSGRPVVLALALFLLHLAATALGDDVGRFVVGSLFQFSEPPSLWVAGGSPLALVGFWIFVPYAATARFFAYLDLRTRREGWDIQTQFAAILLRSLDMKRRAA